MEAGILRSPCSGSSMEQVLNHCVSGGKEKKECREREREQMKNGGRKEGTSL